MTAHLYEGVEHTQPGPFPECLLCRIEALEEGVREIARHKTKTGQTRPAWRLREMAASLLPEKEPS